jgi:DMSO reductase family type II enzyme chaperone
MSGLINMPTPSEKLRGAECEMPSDWAARSEHAPASVFGNYRTKNADESGAVSSDGKPGSPQEASVASVRLQAAIDAAMARSFLYSCLSHAYSDPNEATWRSLSARDTQEWLGAAVRTIDDSPLTAAAAHFQNALQSSPYELFLDAYLAAFGHAARGRCPLNEIEYGDLKADPLFQPHRLADLAAFYRAFGLELGDGAAERHDHLCVELEFMCVLTAKEAYALEHQLDSDELAICRAAQKNFLRDHLARWTPAFARRLVRMAGPGALAALAELTRAFLEAECARTGIVPGNEDLLLRPVDTAADALCQSCGLSKLAPEAERDDSSTR